MASITLFAALTNPTTPELDDNLTIVSNQAPVPCTVSGTNALTLSQVANRAYTVTAYQTGMQFSAIAVASNTSSTTAQLGSLASLNVYKDGPAGPVALVGGEIIANCAFTLVYDAALNSSAGGFHLFSSTASKGVAANPLTLQIGTSSTISRYLTTLSSITLAVSSANAAQGVTIGLTGAVPGDNVMIGPPSTHPAGLALTGYVAASGSVVLLAQNVQTTTIASVAAAYRVSVFL